MSFLYLTADELGTPTGGGAVTANEYAALCELAGGKVECLSRKELAPTGPNVPGEPWYWDETAMDALQHWGLSSIGGSKPFPKLCHVYAGTWPTAIEELKRNGCKVAVTIAAHDRHVSRREHESLGLPFNYPHLVQEDQWQRYVKGYSEADLIICPSTVAARTVREYGGVFKTKPIAIIPHGHGITAPPKPFPKTFTAGYLGVCGGPDKGLRYLLQAWKQLNYPDAVLMLGGRDSTHPWVQQLVHQFGGGNVWATGWVKNVEDFYADCSIYVQPSATEGFGIEVLEAMACGRPVVCSDAAGAVDLLRDTYGAGYAVPACNVGALRWAIDHFYRDRELLDSYGSVAAEVAQNYTWDKIKERYKGVWGSLLK